MIDENEQWVNFVHFDQTGPPSNSTDSATRQSNENRVKLLLGVPDHAVLSIARQKKGYTLQEVADLAKINIRQYQKFESGERDFRSASFSLGLLICQILDIDPQRFL